MSVEKVSPANGAERVSDRTRVPMSVPQQKLSVPEIPGFHMHWMRGDAERISQALRAGYEFVNESDLPGRVVNSLIGGDARTSGNTDLGTRVSVVAGGLGDDGQPSRLILMKIKQEWHNEDLKLQEKQNDGIRGALLAGTLGAEKDNEKDTRYVAKSRTNIRNMFQPKR